jgi:protocatechuate 3,4-dioxygenase, alpha subunit
VTAQITPSQTVGPFLSLGLPWPDGPYVVPAGTPGAVRITGRVLDGAGMPVPDALIETWQADPAGRFAHPDDPRGPAGGALDNGAPAGVKGERGTADGVPADGVPADGVPAEGSTPEGGTAGGGAAGGGAAEGGAAEGAAGPGGAGSGGSLDDRPSGFRGFGRCPTDEQGCYAINTVKPGALPAPDGGIEAPHIDVTVLARGLLNRLVTRIYFPDEAMANGVDPVLRSLNPSRRTTLIAVPEPGALRFDIHLQDSDTGGDGHEETVFFSL